MPDSATVTEVECLLGESQDLYHLALLHAGLLELAAQGKIALRFRAPARTEASLSQDSHTQLIARRAGKTRRIGVDLYDRANVWAEDLLRSSDVYFKRSYWPAAVAERAESNRILPLGLNYAGRHPQTPWAPARAVGGRLLAAFWKNRGQWRRELDRFRQFAASPVIPAFERNADVPAESAIIFQPRLWEPGSTDDNVEEINRLRVEIVRLLKKHLGRRFAGGLVPTPYAKAVAPDLVSGSPVSRPEYVRFSLRFAIGINSRGLHHSIPFKMGEYLAGSFCILSDPMRNELPQPLREGREYLLYRTAEECAAVCERLLQNPGEVKERRRAAWLYYNESVRPERLWGRRLEEAFTL
jgi:hypothetical protein